MTAKQQRLIKDLAALFVKYDIKDWDIVVQGLLDFRSDSKAELQRLIVDLTQQAARSKALSDRSRKKLVKSPKASGRAPSKRLTALRNALASKDIFSTQVELRQLAVNVGLKDSLPVHRSDAIEAIISFLATKTDARVRELLAKARTASSPKTNFDDEFARWAAVILKAEDR